ncbi:MAG: cellulase family glycosylhydrolase, partial [Bryobacteraceae bacterium]
MQICRRDTIQSAVAYARSIGLNVIVCVQDEAQSGETNPASLPNAATQRVWQTLAPLFNADTGILYEVMNEPSLTPSAANWSAWQAAMNAAIATIRATGSANVVIADGLDYAEVLNG